MSQQQAKFPTFAIVGLCFSILGFLMTMPFLMSPGGADTYLVKLGP